MSRKLTIKFDEYGQMNVDATGFAGTQCEDATRRVMAGLADEVSSDKKPEYRQQVTDDNRDNGLRLGL